MDKVDTDCFGRFFSDAAQECRICKDAAVCKKKTIDAGYYAVPLQEDVQKVADTYTAEKIVAVINKVGIGECVVSPQKVSLMSNGDRYCDILFKQKGLSVFCSYAVSGLARYTDKDPRPFSGKIVSYETLEAMLRELDGKRVK